MRNVKTFSLVVFLTFIFSLAPFGFASSKSWAIPPAVPVVIILTPTVLAQLAQATAILGGLLVAQERYFEAARDDQRSAEQRQLALGIATAIGHFEESLSEKHRKGELVIEEVTDEEWDKYRRSNFERHMDDVEPYEPTIVDLTELLRQGNAN